MNKVFVNSAVATKEWRGFVKKVFWSLLFIPSTLLGIPFGVLWLISLGHINLLGIWNSILDKVVEEKLGI